MNKDIYCEYKSGRTDEGIVQQNKDKIKILQTFSKGGSIIIGDNFYPLTYGGLYFINANEEYTIKPDNEEEYEQSICMISSTLMDELSKLLEFENFVEEIFKENGSYYTPLIHFKAVDSRFKDIYGVCRREQGYSKALAMAMVITVLNYGIVSMQKSK